jgi:hypothetical protein
MITNDEMEIKVLERFDLFQNYGIHLDRLRKTSLCIQLPSWKLKFGIFQVYFENFKGTAIKLYMAITKLSVRPFINFIRQSKFIFNVEN